MSDRTATQTPLMDRPGVIRLPKAYQQRTPCPLCAPGHPSCVHTPLGEANMAQGRTS